MGYEIGTDDIDPTSKVEDEPEVPTESQSPITQRSFNYSIKIVNPSRMTDFRTVDLGEGQTVGE